MARPNEIAFELLGEAEMRVLVTLLAVAVVLIAAVVRPATVVACTGCPEPFADVVSGADRVLVVTVASTSPITGSDFSVDRVLKGSSSAEISFPHVYGLDLAVGSRWLIALYPGQGLDTANLWQVRTNGSLGSSGPFSAPATLAEVIAFFEPRPTDTASVDPSRAQASLLLVAAGTVLCALGIATWRRPLRT